MNNNLKNPYNIPPLASPRTSVRIKDSKNDYIRRKFHNYPQIQQKNTYPENDEFPPQSEKGKPEAYIRPSEEKNESSSSLKLLLPSSKQKKHPLSLKRRSCFNACCCSTTLLHFFNQVLLKKRGKGVKPVNLLNR